MKQTTTRRGFMAASAGILSAANAAGRPLRLGGPVFLKSADPRELAREHRRLGYSAAFCPNATVENTALVREIEQAFAAENVVIAEVGAWRNILDPDAEKRRANLAYVTGRLALAEAVGARCAVDIAGSYNPDVWYGPHPRNFSREFFDATVENCRRLIDAVKPRRTKFTLEMMGWALPEGPDSYLKLIRAIDRPAFAVHLDVCNGVNSPERFYKNGEFIGECFSKLGRWIVSCHAKDLRWPPELNVHFVEVAPGRGGIDYRAYLIGLAKLSGDVPLMMEHLKKPEEYEEAKRHILKTASELGLSFA